MLHRKAGASVGNNNDESLLRVKKYLLIVAICVCFVL